MGLDRRGGSPFPPNRIAQLPSEEEKGVNWYEHQRVDKAINGDPKHHELVPREVKIIRSIALRSEKDISMHDPDMTRNRTWLVCLHWRFLGTRKTNEAWEWSVERIWEERIKSQGDLSDEEFYRDLLKRTFAPPPFGAPRPGVQVLSGMSELEGR